MPLLVTFVRADHAHHTVAANHFAVPAHLFDGCPDFHSRLQIPDPRLADRATAPVIAQVGFLHHALVLMAHRVRLHLRHEIHRDDDENQQ